MTKKSVAKAVAVVALGALGYAGGVYAGKAQANSIKAPRSVTTVKDRTLPVVTCVTCYNRYNTPGTNYYMNAAALNSCLQVCN